MDVLEKQEVHCISAGFFWIFHCLGPSYQFKHCSSSNDGIEERDTAKWFNSIGVFGLLWSLTWMLVVAESPEKDQKISAEELKYITESLGGCEPITKLKVPWGSFATSAPVWAISLANFSENWGGYTLVTQLPKFMKSVLKFDLNEAGFMSCLPYLGNSISVPIAGYLADLCIVRSSFSTTQIRKAFNCGGFIGQTVFLLTPIFLWEPTGTVICITVAQSLGAFAMAGFNVNHLDLGPQYASILMGIANTFGTVPGIISPIVAGYIVTDENRVDQWRIIFYVSSAVYLFGAIMYGTFASCELQPWATKVEYSRSNKNKHESIEKQGGSYENESFQKEIE
ncbi:sialin [Leptinotarsa decemlineata]|uniref:sialin n=1 Tax=Leptinotarsa decemlineata TaxID=7539 RepID=UPI003D30966E